MARREWFLLLAGLAIGLAAAAFGCTGPQKAQTPTSIPSQTATPKPTASIPPTPPDAVAAKVVRVIDGDTIEVDIEGAQYTVRYIGIDTPETVAPGRPVDCYGPEASVRNKELVEGKTVRLEKDVSETDRYGRLLRYVYVDGVMVNAELVRLGYAQVSTFPPDVKYADMLLRLQRETREASRGLWGACPLPSPTAAPTPSGKPCPPDRPIKGNVASSGEKIYHVPGGAFYDRTDPEECFASETEAQAAGYRPSQR